MFRLPEENLSMTDVGLRARAQRVLGIVASAALGLTFIVGGIQSTAQADELDQEKKELEQRQNRLKSNLEGLDESIAEKVQKLEGLQAQLPGAQKALADVETRVQAATDEVESLNQRLATAEQQKTDVKEEIASNEKKMDKSEKLIGQIASEAYKRGGVSEDLSFILGMSESSLPDSLGMANQAIRVQDQRLSSDSQRNAADRNAEARLKAVEKRISSLKKRAEEALEREEAAKKAAAEHKASVEGMIGEAEKLTKELKAKRPEIQKQLRANQAAQNEVNQKIAERQERLRREEEERRRKAEAERKRKEEAARKRWQAEQARLAAEAKRQNKPAPKPKPFVPPAAPAAPSGGSHGLTWPVSGPITSEFGWRPTPAGTFDYGGRGGYVHTGTDFGSACGTPIRAAAAGEVWYADWAVWTSGNRVVISHGVVNGRALATKYHHMTRYVVSPGQRVSKGQVIGYVGTTGNSTGCHLHFETIVNGTAVNPRTVV